MPDPGFSSLWLEDEPEGAFNAFLSPLLQSPLNRRILPSLFNNVWRQFLGSAGLQAQQGQLDPTALPSFNTFLQQGRTPQQMLFSLPRFDRGAHSSFFNPRTRFLFT